MSRWTTAKNAVLGMFIGTAMAAATLAAAMAVAGFIAWAAS